MSVLHRDYNGLDEYQLEIIHNIDVALEANGFNDYPSWADTLGELEEDEDDYSGDSGAFSIVTCMYGICIKWGGEQAPDPACFEYLSWCVAHQDLVCVPHIHYLAELGGNYNGRFICVMEQVITSGSEIHQTANEYDIFNEAGDFLYAYMYDFVSTVVEAQYANIMTDHTVDSLDAAINYAENELLLDPDVIEWCVEFDDVVSYYQLDIHRGNIGIRINKQGDPELVIFDPVSGRNVEECYV